MKLREYARDDLPAVLSLFYETVHAMDPDTFTQAQMDAWAPVEQDANAWQERLTNSSAFVAEHKDRIVGFGNVTVLGLVDTLYVHRSAQKTGVGAALLMRLIAEAKCKGVHLVQTEANATARAFFEKQGFKVVREQRKERGGQTFQTFVMSRDIPVEDASDGGDEEEG